MNIAGAVNGALNGGKLIEMHLDTLKESQMFPR